MKAAGRASRAVTAVQRRGLVRRPGFTDSAFQLRREDGWNCGLLGVYRTPTQNTVWGSKGAGRILRHLEV